MTEKTVELHLTQRLPQARHPLALPAGLDPLRLTLVHEGPGSARTGVIQTLGETLGTLPLCGRSRRCRLFRALDGRTPMTGPLYHLGRFCARHHWPVIAVWIVAAIAIALAGRAAGDHTSDNLTLPGTGSTKAHRPARGSACPSRPTAATRSSSRPRSGKLTDSSNTQARRRHGQGAEEDAARHQGDQPARRRRRGVPQQGQDDRLHPGDARRRPERPHGGGGAGDPRRRRPGEEGRDGGRRRRLRRPAALQAEHRESEAIGLARRGGHPAVRVRDGHRDGAADRHRGPRPRERAARSSSCSATSSTCRPSRRRSRR